MYSLVGWNNKVSSLAGNCYIMINNSTLGHFFCKIKLHWWMTYTAVAAVLCWQPTNEWTNRQTSVSIKALFHCVQGLNNKKAQLSLTNPRDAKACQKLLQFDVLTTLSLTILAYLHAFSCCCVWNLRNPEEITKNSNLWSSRSSKVIDLGANRKPICDLLLVINSNFSRICYRFRDIHS